MTKKKIAVVTGTRAEYGLLKSPLSAIRNRESLTASIIATGMHLSPQYGHTVDDIYDDGFEVDREVKMLLDGDDEHTMAKSLGIGISGLADAFADMDPDIVLVLGDRGEAFAAGVAAAHMNIPVAHIHGGDAMKGAMIDDCIRHALTKFAHIHFPASAKSSKRIQQLGEEGWRIHTVGAPGLDAIRENEYTDPETIRARYELSKSEPLVLVIQHPVTTQVEKAGHQMEVTLEALDAIDTEGVIIYPNSDAGGKQMIEVIDQGELVPHFERFVSLPRVDYLGLMDAADVLVGNSSSGIIESTALHLPAVDIGPRQDGRERGNNVISVPHEVKEIRQAVRDALEVAKREKIYESPYDFGGAGERIADVLSNVELTDALLRKKLTFKHE